MRKAARERPTRAKSKRNVKEKRTKVQGTKTGKAKSEKKSAPKSRKTDTVRRTTRTAAAMLTPYDLDRSAREQIDEFSVIGHLTHSRKAG